MACLIEPSMLLSKFPFLYHTPQTFSTIQKYTTGNFLFSFFVINFISAVVAQVLLIKLFSLDSASSTTHLCSFSLSSKQLARLTCTLSSIFLQFFLKSYHSHFHSVPLLKYTYFKVVNGIHPVKFIVLIPNLPTRSI
jgi:hypothetical protein